MKFIIIGNGKLANEISNQTFWNMLSKKEDGIDITKPSTYEDTIAYYDVIINCIANTNTKDNTKDAHWDVNYVGVMDLVDMCNKYNKKLIHISTDYLYANCDSNAKETDVPMHVNNWYTYTKLLSDGYVQARCKDYLMIRTSFKLRPYPWDVAWIDILTNADYIDIIASYIVDLIKKDAKGVYNVGTEPKTFYELAKQTVPNCNYTFDDKSYNRPHDVTMDLTKMKTTLKI